MIKLSERMQAVASMVTAGNRLADIGTDHGYIPIVLVQEGKIPSAIAADINAGPLERAGEHIAACHLEDRIRTIRGDGLKGILPGEVDTILIAGMGGELIVHILTEGEEVCRAAKELVLQPQSELKKVRKYLRQHNYRIVDEDMVLEDGKYYPMMRVEADPDGSRWNRMEPKMVTTCDIYGPVLLKNGNPVLRKYLVREFRQLQTICESLEKQPQTPAILQRKAEIEEKMRYNESAYTLLEDLVNAGF